LFYQNIRALRGRSDFNVGQNLSLNALWALPTPKSLNGFAKAAIGGWQVGGIAKLNNGVPTTVIINGDSLGLGNGGADQFAIPNLTPGCDPINHSYAGTGQNPIYIKTSCYTLPTVAASSATAALCNDFSSHPTPPAGQVNCSNLLGNAGRNSLIGPKLVNIDFSATKNNSIKRISETFNIQFRAEIFNIFNHSNFNPPEPTAGAGVFADTGAAGGNGGIDALATSARDVQFALKVIW
jgi:hypothetical protein